MSCAGYDSCVNRERENMNYPMDNESLYANRFHDNQTAHSRCYQEHPIDILEGFGCKISWEKILKLVIVILLIILFVSLAKDFMYPLKELPQMGGTEFSDLHLTPIF